MVHISFWITLTILINLAEAYILIEKNTEALVGACKKMRLEVKADTTKYMVMYRDQNAGRIL
jgi:hypothetical protein